MGQQRQLADAVALPCGATLKNRMAKSAMSDSLGDGRGTPTKAQIALYGIWAQGGAALSIIGEVQGDPTKAEKPGNLVVPSDGQPEQFRKLAHAGAARGAHLWCQLGNAGAMAHPPIGVPKGPSALDIDGLTCAALTEAEIAALPVAFARTAARIREFGFGGVQIHAAHGFLLSQFLSPFFNRRGDRHGGALSNRMRLTLDVVDAVRDAVGPDFPVGLKLNATDQLEGGFTQSEALTLVAALDRTSLDLIDISCGTYFPGAPSASDGAGKGPYFLEFAEQARRVTDKPLMLTGGVKTHAQAVDAVQRGVDLMGMARALILAPGLPNAWMAGQIDAPQFPRFSDPPQGGVTAWYTMRLTDLAAGHAFPGPDSLAQDMAVYDARDAKRAELWNAYFAT